VRAGGASSVEETRAVLAVETARVELTSMEREQAIAYRRLAGVWGSLTPRFIAVRGDLARVTAPAPLDTLLARIERNPDVARWAAEISRRESAHAAARALRVPDLTLDAGIRRLGAARETGFLVGVGIPIPLFDRGQDAAAAAGLRIDAANEQQQSARVEGAILLGIAHEEAAAGLAEYHQLKDDLLPRARNAHEAASSAYRSGLLRLTDVLDVQRVLFEAAMRTVDALVRYHTAAFEIERLTGLPVAASNSKEQE
jgi:cobalt-zinc-cadmium efflux system outer membrane protein